MGRGKTPSRPPLRGFTPQRRSASPGAHSHDPVVCRRATVCRNRGKWRSRGCPDSSRALPPSISMSRRMSVRGKHLFCPSRGSPGVPPAPTPIKIPSEGCPVVGIHSPPITRFPVASPGFPPHQNILVGMLGRGNFLPRPIMRRSGFPSHQNILMGMPSRGNLLF